MSRVDTRRNGELFSANEFRESGGTVLIVGLGMLGSHIAELLARLGIDLQLCDFDKVEAHNVSNQACGLQEIGMFKTDAMKLRLERDCGISVRAVTHAFVPSLLPARVVICAPDSNDARKEVWRHVRGCFGVELYIEVRTGPLSGRIYSIDPWDSRQVDVYENPQIMYADADAVDRGNGACQQKVSLAFTGYAIASLAVAQFVRWSAIRKGSVDKMDNEIIHYLHPPKTYARSFV